MHVHFYLQIYLCSSHPLCIYTYFYVCYLTLLYLDIRIFMSLYLVLTLTTTLVYLSLSIMYLHLLLCMFISLCNVSTLTSMYAFLSLLYLDIRLCLCHSLFYQPLLLLLYLSLSLYLSCIHTYFYAYLNLCLFHVSTLHCPLFNLALSSCVYVALNPPSRHHISSLSNQ